MHCGDSRFREAAEEAKADLEAEAKEDHQKNLALEGLEDGFSIIFAGCLRNN